MVLPARRPLAAARRRPQLISDSTVNTGDGVQGDRFIGIVDGQDVLGLIPLNAADNVLHAALAALGRSPNSFAPTDHRASRPLGPTPANAIVLLGQQRQPERLLIEARERSMVTALERELAEAAGAHVPIALAGAGQGLLGVQ